MEILDKKSNRMSRANAGVSERSDLRKSKWTSSLRLSYRSEITANSWFFIVKKFTQ